MSSKRKLKRLTAAAIMGAMVFGAYPASAAENSGAPFTDVDPDAWYAEAVEYVSGSGIMSGTGASRFSPDQTVSRGMLASVLYRMAGSPQTEGAAFNDIPEGSYYEQAAAWANENGVMSGYGNGAFRGGEPVTREQLVSVLWRYYGSPESENDAEFSDESDISNYAVDAVNWAVSQGIISGVGNNRFNPKGTATRAQTAYVLQNFANISGNSAAPSETESDGIVQTTAGLIQGTNQNGIYRYLGVPYAEATERFVQAGPVEPWEGVRMADTYGPISPQGVISGLDGESDQTGTDNNCQNLNIWTPGVNDGEKRPVMVWLHGGGFSTGSGNEAGYDGENLSRDGDVVVVSVNHRLNVFGHLDLSAYGDKYKYSENVGITDIVAALEWIRDNIEAFGGDPDNVTVFGQSGGGAKVLALMTSPYAEGLFDKGIVQSGATETMGVSFNTKEASQRLAENILDILGITADNIEDIQSVPADQLQEAATEALQITGEELQIPAALGGTYSMDWEPVVDGDFLPTNPITDESFAEAGRDIPLLIGSNLNEWSGILPSPVTVEPSQELDEAIAAAYPNEDGLTVDQIDSTIIRLPILKIMTHKADQNGAPVYAYMFTYGHSYHGAEILYVFDNLTNATEQEKELAHNISQAWINFAKTGVPSSDGLPAWEPYTRENGATMILDTESEMAYHHDQQLMEILAPDYEY